MKLDRSLQFSEMNPVRPDVPEEIRQISPVLYDYLLQQAKVFREQHNKTQAGDTTFPWEVLTFTSPDAQYTLGSLGRFKHNDYGIILARYVRFVEMSQVIYEGSPVGIWNSVDAHPWEVTNQLTKSSEDMCLGLCGSYEKPASGSYGWVIVSGVNLQTVYVDEPPAVGMFVGWSGSGHFGLTQTKLAKVKAADYAFDPELLWGLNPGTLIIDSMSFASKYTPPETEPDESINELREQITQIGDDTEIRFGILEKTVDDQGDALNRTGTILSQRVFYLNPSRMRGLIEDQISLSAQYANLASVAADNASADANKVITTLQAINELKRSAEVAKTEAGFQANSATEMANQAALSRNDANVSASAASTFASQAAVSATDAATQATNASASATTATSAATSASTSSSSASTSATQAATSASNAAGSAASASTSAVTAANAATAAASAGGGAKFDGSSINNFSEGATTNPLNTTYWSLINLQGAGNVLAVDQRVAGAPADWGVRQKNPFKIAPNRVYRITVRVTNQIGPTLTNHAMYILFLNAAGAYIGDTTGVWNNVHGTNLPSLAAASGATYTADVNSADILNDAFAYANPGPDVVSIVPYYRATKTGANYIRVEDLSIDDITTVGNLAASVTVNTTAIADLNTQLAAAAFEVVTVAGSATAAIRVKSETSPGVFQSSVALEAQEIQFFSGTSHILAGKIVGLVSTWYGDMNVLGSIRVGANKVPVALQSFQVQAADGETVSFGADLTNAPQLIFDSSQLAPKTASQQYYMYATSLTSTGFVMNAKIQTPGASGTQSAGLGSNVGGTPKWQSNKPTAADSSTGYYTYTVTATVNFPVNSFDGTWYWGFLSFDVWIRPNGSSWTKIGTFAQNVHSLTSGNVSKSGVYVGYYASPVSNGAATEFGVHDVAGTITQFTNVTYPTNSATVNASASPNGEKVIVNVIPQNY